MNRLKVLLDEYASADETGRLHLFLNHRSFRDHFLRIEVEEMSAAAGKRGRVARPVRRWLDRWHSGLETI